jgi:5'-nucleotidase
MNDDRIALFDMDGSLADFETAMRRDMCSLRSPHEPEITDTTNLHDLEDEHPYIKARMDLIKARVGWWRSLERIESGFVIVEAAKRIGYKINILTKAPSGHPGAWKEKVEWCQAQPELVGADIHLTMNKGLVYGTFLFDDFTRYMDLWLTHRPRGLGIMPVTDDNTHYTHPNVIKWDGANLDEVVRAMQAAYDRAPREALILS